MERRRKRCARLLSADPTGAMSRRHLRILEFPAPEFARALLDRQSAPLAPQPRFRLRLARPSRPSWRRASAWPEQPVVASTSEPALFHPFAPAPSHRRSLPARAVELPPEKQGPFVDRPRVP